MTKNEIIFLCYGYIAADSHATGKGQNLVAIIEEHLFPQERIQVTGTHTSPDLDFGDEEKRQSADQ